MVSPPICTIPHCWCHCRNSDANVLATAKKRSSESTARHGDISTYSEPGLPVLLHSPERLGQIELPPFQSAIAAGVDSVMTAHLLIPEWDRQRPASLSEKILQGQKKLGFQGLIVTDSLQNPGIMQDYGAEKAAVMAVEAGADILLTPLNIDAAIRGLYDAVNNGRISQQRIRASVERIWQAKLKVCQESETGQNFSLEPRNSLSQMATPEAMNVVANILRDSQPVGGILSASQLCNNIIFLGSGRIPRLSPTNVETRYIASPKFRVSEISRLRYIASLQI